MARMNATLVFAIMRVAVLNMLPNLVMKSDSKKLGSNLILGRLRATIFGYINILNVIFSGQAGFGLVSGFSGFSCNITSLIQSYSSNSKLSMQWPWPFGAHLNNEQILTFWFKLRNL